MRAIILAAGEGIRLRPYTDDRPKCMVELANQPLLAHQVNALKTAGVDDICVVTGCRAEQIEALGFETRYNPEYDSSNMVTSLMCAADWLDGEDDVIIAYADLVYEPEIIEALIECNHPICTTIDESWLDLWKMRFDDPLCDAETLKLNGRGNIEELGEKPTSYGDIEGQYMGLIKVKRNFAPKLVAFYNQLDPHGDYDGRDLSNMYMTTFLQSLISAGVRIKAVVVDGGWLEVDSVSDLEMYERMYSSGELDEYCRISLAGAVL